MILQPPPRPFGPEMPAPRRRLLFFVGLHNVADARRFPRAFISVNRLRNRKATFEAAEWIMDSGAFTEISTHGRYRHGAEAYVREIERWRGVGRFLAAVTQDWMCEPFIVKKTGLSVAEHQRLTIERFDEIRAATTAPIMPVLQGFETADYVRHLGDYGSRLAFGAWVGVGSVCKRNADPAQVESILLALKTARPDLRLHGFGLKTTALEWPTVRDLLHSADSMAWSFAARREGRNGNDWREAARFADRINSPIERSIFS